MPTITRLEVQKRDKQRVSVFVDDGFFCGLSIDDVVRNKLAPGTQLTESELADLSKVSDENKYFNKTLEYLLKSPKTELQIKQYLYKKQLEPQTVNSILSRLKTLNYINDTDYAENYVRAKSAKYGVKMIRRKLAQKGIKSDNIDAGDQTELARSVAAKYMRNKDTAHKELQKLYRYLTGKGFDFDLINSIVDGYR